MSAASLSKIRAAATPPWLITFVDLVFLLLAFFILMFSMAQPEPTHYAAVTKSLAEEFQSNALGGEEFVNSRTYVRENEDNIDDMTYLAAALKAALAKSEHLGHLQFRSTERALMISLPGAVDGQKLSNEYRAAFFDLGGVLANIQNPIAVVGVAGSTADTWVRGLQDAGVVAEALKRVGYDRPIPTLARVPERADENIEIMIMADPETSEQMMEPQQ
jgi:chemotaxis protein MotB